jgi:hypothetical protein
MTEFLLLGIAEFLHEHQLLKLFALPWVKRDEWIIVRIQIIMCGKGVKRDGSFIRKLVKGEVP